MGEPQIACALLSCTDTLARRELWRCQRAHTGGNGLFPGIQIEEVWPSAPVVRDAPIRSNEVQTFWGRTIGFINGIVHLFDQHGHGQVQVQAARRGHGLTFRVTLVLPEQDPFGHVTVRLPAIRRMRLLDIDHEKCDVVTVAAIDVLHTPHLGPEGRSGVAAKDQGHRPLSPKAGEADPFLSAESFEAEVGWRGAHLWPHLIPRRYGLESRVECWGERVALRGEHLAHRVARPGGCGTGAHVLHKVAKMVAVRLTQTGHHAVALGFVHDGRPSGMSECGVDSYRDRRSVPCHL